MEEEPLGLHVTCLSDLPNEVKRKERRRHGEVAVVTLKFLGFLALTDGSGDAQKLASKQPQYYNFELAALEPLASGISLFRIPALSL